MGGEIDITQLRTTSVELVHVHSIDHTSWTAPLCSCTFLFDVAKECVQITTMFSSLAQHSCVEVVLVFINQLNQYLIFPKYLFMGCLQRQ